MKTSLIFLLLSLISFHSFSQDDKDYSLKFDSESLKNSTPVTVAGVQVPLKVVTEIQKVCDQKNLTVDECNTLTEKGCLEFTRVYEDKNIKTIEVPVNIEVDLHINEHKHIVHKEQKKYTYHYDIRVINTQTESHEYVQLDPVHEAPTYSNSAVATKPKQYTYEKQTTPIQKPIVEGRKITSTHSGIVHLPSHLRLTQDIARFVQNNGVQVQVMVRGQSIDFSGPAAHKLASIVFKHFPTAQRFDRATNSQVVEMFEDLKRNFL